MIKNALAYALVRAGRRRKPPVDVLEALHRAPEVPAFNDSLYLYGRDPDGTALATRLSVRTAAPAEVWMSVRFPGEPIAEVPSVHHPIRAGREAGGLRWEAVETGRRWAVRYDGPLRRDGATVDAAIDLVFTGSSPLIDFADGIRPRATARALAREPWSRRFFEQLGEIRTTHYEQVGRVVGTVRLGDVERAVDLVGLRDHSFGRREWATWRRHMWLSGVCEDGRAFTVARIRYAFVGPLTAGFVLGDEAVAIGDCSPFDAVAAPGEIPERLALDLVTATGRHRLTGTTDGAFEFPVDGGYRLVEAIAAFELDGVPAVGICELGWRADG